MDVKNKEIVYLCQSCGHREMLVDAPNFCGHCGAIYKGPTIFKLEKPVLRPLDDEETRMYENINQYASKEKIIRKMCKTCDAHETPYGEYFECNAFHQFLIPKTEETTHFCEGYKNKNRIVCPVCHYAFSKSQTSTCPICHQYTSHTEYEVALSLGKCMAFLLLVIVPIFAMIMLLTLNWDSQLVALGFFPVILPVLYFMVMIGEDYLTNTTSTTEWRIAPQADREEQIDEDDDDDW